MSPSFREFFKPKPAKKTISDTPVGSTIEDARVLTQRGQWADAKSVCREIVERQPDQFDVLILWAEIEARQANPDLAAELYARAIKLRPDAALAHYKLGNLLKNRNELEASLLSYDKAIEFDPGYANAFCNRGVVLAHLNRVDEALASYEQAIALNPRDALAHFNRGNLFKDRNQMEAALSSYDEAVALDPGYAHAFCNRGVVLGHLDRPEEALTSYDQAIAIDAGSALAYYNRGDALRKLKRWDEALTSYNLAIAAKPNYAEAHCNRGVILLELKEWQAAVASFKLSLEIDPFMFQAYHNCGQALVHLNQHLAAVAHYDRACSLDPNFRFLMGTRRHARMNLCDWEDMETEMDRLTSGILDGAAVSPPFAILALLKSPELHHRSAKIWVREEHPAESLLPPIARLESKSKIRLGYFSADFYDHPVGVLSAEFLKRHDRSKFEVTAFSFGPDSQDGVRKRLEIAVDRFVDVRGKSELEIALLARSLSIDIAIDLGGHTGNSRTRIFALRAAPIQVNYLGYPGSMGATYMDYIIGDATVIPEAQQRHYTEKIAYLPNTYLPHDASRVISDIVFARKDLGLPSEGFVFCCFNNNYKITPDTFDSWMRILSRVEKSVLWLSRKNPTSESNLRREALGRGVDPNRLIFADRVSSSSEHLARQRVADLFLDTWPYNAHATALDALWAGLPVLTRIGDGFAGRVAASLLNVIELPELITATAQQYEDLAVQLAFSPQLLAKIRKKLGENRRNTALFDTELFTKHLETAFSKMYERYQVNLPPDHIHVQS